MFRPFLWSSSGDTNILYVECSIELQDALTIIWAHIYNGRCLVTILRFTNLLFRFYES
jgi:hypothetical protein